MNIFDQNEDGRVNFHEFKNILDGEISILYKSEKLNRSIYDPYNSVPFIYLN